jgi:hypothetical protein
MAKILLRPITIKKIIFHITMKMTKIPPRPITIKRGLKVT